MDSYTINKYGKITQMSLYITDTIYINVSIENIATDKTATIDIFNDNSDDVLSQSYKPKELYDYIKSSYGKDVITVDNVNIMVDGELNEKYQNFLKLVSKMLNEYFLNKNHY